jgi:hypothetical protein
MTSRATALLLFLLAASTGAASAQAVTTVETELVKGRCKFIADDGEVGHYALKRCPGLAGSRVYTTAGVNDVALSFKWGKKEAEVFSNGGLGLKLEWRGVKGKQGFVPHAVIVQRTFKHYVDDKYEKEEKHDVWAVIRMEKRNACLMAVIDAAANPDALKLARNIADDEAPNSVCAKLKPKIAGEKTRWTEEAIGTDEPPPK